MSTFKTISPADGSVYTERAFTETPALPGIVDRARKAQRDWQAVPVAERAAICERFVLYMEKQSPSLAREITGQMGRPISQSPGEIRGLAERARYMIGIAESSLADIQLPEKSNFNRFIRREALGVVFTIAPWNYPYLTAVNSVIPALMSGNAVILKHAKQTPLCAERFAEGFEAAGMPAGVFQFVHLTHDQTAQVIEAPGVDFVAFTGSVPGGYAVQKASRKRFIGMGLELGGKDPAYVRSDAPFDETVENLVDGVFFNSGQSCCGIERIYVHQNVYEKFVEAFVDQAKGYRLGDPMDPNTNLGPMVRTSAAQYVRGQIKEALSKGARSLIDPNSFAANKDETPYLAPQILIDVDHGMEIMTEETFGPAVGIMSVDSDEAALKLMNDSQFGLTASVWTTDLEASISLGERLETGTVFMNRCDALDPALAWVGVKDSGRGCTLSSIGYEQLTRPKSYHLRTQF